MSGNRNQAWVLLVAMGLTMVAGMQPAEALPGCPGCGAGGEQQAPCFSVIGQLVYQYTGQVFHTGILYKERVTRVGPCQFRDVITRLSDGVVVWDSSFSAGCPCGGPDAPYDPNIYPAINLQLMSLTDTGIILQSPQGLTLVKVVDMHDGFIVHSRGPVSSGGSFVVPRTILPPGVYLVEGFVASGRLDASTVLRVSATGGVTTGQRQVMWAAADPSNYPVRQLAVYTATGEVKLVIQRQDNSLELATGESSVAVPGASPVALAIVGAGLLLGAGLVLLRRKETEAAA